MSRARGVELSRRKRKDRSAPLFRSLEGERQGKDLPGQKHRMAGHILGRVQSLWTAGHLLF